MARNFGVNLTRQQAPSQVIQSPLQRGASAIASLFSASQTDAFDEMVPSDVKAEFQQRAQAYAAQVYPEGGDVLPTPQSCEDAYALLQGWFSHINSYAPGLENAAGMVNGSVARNLLQANFAYILNPVRRAVMDNVKERARNIGAAAQTTGLEEVYEILSQAFTLLTPITGGITPVETILFVKDVARNIQQLEGTLQDLEDTFDTGLDIPTSVRSAVLPPLAKLVNPTAWSESTGQSVSDRLAFCQAGVVESLASVPRDAGPHNLLAVTQDTIGGSTWGEISTGQVSSNPVWNRTQQEADDLVTAYGETEAYLAAAFQFQAIGGILAYLVEQFATQEDEDQSWWQALYAQLVELYELAVDVFQALYGDFTGILATIVSEVNQTIADNIISIEQAHKEIYSNVSLIPAALLAFQAEGLNYTPDSGFLSDYISLRNSTLASFVNDLYRETSVVGQTYDPAGVYTAIKTLIACCYYNQSVYFYKNGFPGQSPGDVENYELWKLWVEQSRVQAAEFQQAASSLEMLDRGVESLLRDEIIEKQFAPQDIFVNRDIMQNIPQRFDRRQRVQQRVRKGRRPQRLGSLLPAQNPALYPVGLAILAYIAYRHLQGK